MACVWYDAIMHKTTIYLPEPLRDRVKLAAVERHVSEAEIIRAAIDAYTAPKERPRPKLPLFSSGLPDLAERADEYLHGFGED